MREGLIFDSKEFSVHDGPGVRQTVFLKGCPLRCNWCHNPEGWEMRPQLLRHSQSCIRCGICDELCKAPDCVACGACVVFCPVRARQVCGEYLTSAELIKRLEKNAAIYADMGGGVTFSGGEPLMQADFLIETASGIGGMHKALETCGYAEPEAFAAAAAEFDLILMDIKLMDAAAHRAYTGADNAVILKNARRLCDGNTAFIIRIPLIPGVTDTEENTEAAARFFCGAKALQYVELLPYNRMAGAKYGQLGLKYEPRFDVERPVIFRHAIFERYGIESRGR